MQGSRPSVTAAEARLASMTSLDPTDVGAWLALAKEYGSIGLLHLARGAARRAVSIRPADVEAQRALGWWALESGDPEGAIEAYETCRRLEPNNVEVLQALADAYRIDRRMSEALECANRALKMEGSSAGYSVLGDALRCSSDAPLLEAAATIAYRSALEIDPKCIRAMNGLAALHLTRARWDDARVLYDESLRIASWNPVARYRRALLDLRRGAYREGYATYPAVMDTLDDRSRFYYRAARVPLWDGTDLGDQRLVIAYEQGLGDHLMMARFFPMLSRYGSRIVVETAPELVNLLRRCLPNTVFRAATQWEHLETMDLHLPIMQLPGVLGIASAADIRPDAPYLFPDPSRVAAMQHRLSLDPQYRHIGIIWRGNPRNARDRWRTAALTHWAPLGRVPGVRFHSLQLNASEEELRSAPIRLDPTHRFIEDIDDTAALMSALDLVITVDTSTVHLAGALGRPTWMPNSLVSDYRWGIDASDSPWYPTLRLFRQRERDGWGIVFANIADALLQYVHPGDSPPTRYGERS